MRALRSLGSGGSMVLRVTPTVSRSASVDHGFRERGEGLGHTEAPLVDRAPDDDPRERTFTRSEPGQRAQVVERADTPAGDQRDAAGGEHRSELPERRAL